VREPASAARLDPGVRAGRLGDTLRATSANGRYTASGKRAVLRGAGPRIGERPILRHCRIQRHQAQ
jgi:hypothetical protein